MSWPKVSSLVFRLWSLPWTNGLNTQLKWKLRYSPIQCAYLEPFMTHFSERRCNRICLDRKLTRSCWCFHWFFGLRVDFWQILLQVHTRHVATQFYKETMSNKNVKIGFQSAVFHLLSASVSAIFAKWYRLKRNGLYLGLAKTDNALRTSVFLQYYIQFWVILDVMRE